MESTPAGKAPNSEKHRDGLQSCALKSLPFACFFLAIVAGAPGKGEGNKGQNDRGPGLSDMLRCDSARMLFISSGTFCQEPRPKPQGQGQTGFDAVACSVSVARVIRRWPGNIKGQAAAEAKGKSATLSKRV